MAETIKLPGVGPVDKKWVYVGGALVAGIVGYAYWTKARAEESEITDFTEVTDPDAIVDGGVDDYVNPGGSRDPINEDNSTAPSNNAEWSFQAFDKLTDNGYNPLKVSTALGKYLARGTLTPNQGAIIRAAHAFLGPPPIGKFPIKIGKGEPDNPDKPDVQLPIKVAPTGLSAHDIGSTTVGLLWNAVSGARYYSVSIPGKSSALNTASTHLSVTGLKRNTLYSVKVRAHGMDKKPGPYSLSRTFRTKR